VEGSACGGVLWAKPIKHPHIFRSPRESRKTQKNTDEHMKYKNLENYLTLDEPFGPIDTVDIAHDDVDVLQTLFAPYNFGSFGFRVAIER